MRKHLETKFGEAFPERKSLPFFGLVGELSYEDMLRTRIRLRERCLVDKDFRSVVIQACALDVCFFAAMFAVFHETRRTEDRQGAFPVHLDPDQADVLACFQAYGGLQDVTVE